MNIQINFDYYDQILNVYGKIISKKQTSYTNVELEEKCTSNTVQHLNAYIVKSITTLKKVIQLALNSNNQNLAYASLEVFNYLTLPNNIVRHNNTNYKGYFDDAWLIHNFAKYCVDNGYFPQSAFDDTVVDNPKIDIYLSKEVSKSIYSNLHKKLNNIIKEFQI